MEGEPQKLTLPYPLSDPLALPDPTAVREPERAGEKECGPDGVEVRQAVEVTLGQGVGLKDPCNGVKVKPPVLEALSVGEVEGVPVPPNPPPPLLVLPEKESSGELLGDLEEEAQMEGVGVEEAKGQRVGVVLGERVAVSAVEWVGGLEVEWVMEGEEVVEREGEAVVVWLTLPDG